ncbi:MAG: RNA pseudouridine synthase [Gammaproteobacteria bacterium]|nr:RNA pseudouridine synthase [Gammaproteobacteria bacterium]
MSNIPLKTEQHITIENSDESVIEKLQQVTGLSRQKIKQAMQKGAVWYTRGKTTQRLRRVKKSLKPDDVVHCYYDERVLSAIPPEPELIADEGDYSIWYKPYGLRSQGSKWGDHCTINRTAEKILNPQRPCFIVHRLDRAASGLIILAHTKSKAAEFSLMFKQRKIDKRYRAIVHGEFPAIDKEKTIQTEIEGKPAISHIMTLAFDKEINKSLVQIRIETGRKHQIRRHLSESGYPIVGDRLYGIEGDDENLCLTSCYLAFKLDTEEKPKEYNLPSILLPKLY